MLGVFGWFVLVLKSDIFVVIVSSDDEPSLLRQYVSLYQDVSHRMRKKKRKGR